MPSTDSYNSSEFTNFIFKKGLFPGKSSFHNKSGIFTLFLKSREIKNQKSKKPYTPKKKNKPIKEKKKKFPQTYKEKFTLPEMCNPLFPVVFHFGS